VFGGAFAAPAPARAPQLLEGKAAFTDLRADRPRLRLRRPIRPADLPPLNLAGYRANEVQVATRGRTEKPSVPPGFQVSLFASALGSLLVSEEANGTIWRISTATSAHN
jgi:hypothetical protein